MNEYKIILSKYIPENAVEIIYSWIMQYKFHLRISRSRATKLGDYRPPVRKHTHKISINYNLNKYAFLITLVHEIAHLIVWDKYKKSVKPHGKEWKTEFKYLMSNFFENKIFPKDLSDALLVYLENAFASSVSDLDLTRILNNYNNKSDFILLEELPQNTVFKIHNGRIFKKQEKLRKRYRCLCLENKKEYLFNPLAQVVPVNT